MRRLLTVWILLMIGCAQPQIERGVVVGQGGAEIRRGAFTSDAATCFVSLQDSSIVRVYYELGQPIRNVGDTVLIRRYSNWPEPDCYEMVGMMVPR